PVIVATQMLESMRSAPRATRAEVNDVASAVFDAADAVMLSAETAAGEYPLEAVQTMREIIEATEDECSQTAYEPPDGRGDITVPHAIARAVRAADQYCNASLICAFTTSAFTARLITSLRPSQPVLALTHSDTICRQVSLLWSVTAMPVEEVTQFTEMEEVVDRCCKEFKLARRGDVVIITGGMPLGTKAPTNFMHVHEVR
ncbi:pyruvate kinase, partial [candidate division GN15 bacterium]|nr:pyruvate kinase [candidate division GN15 bacterium]